MAISDNEYARLEELSNSDFEVAEGQPDIKGWDVKTTDGLNIGDVVDLLFNPQTQKVRYIIVDTDANDLKLNARHVLIPIGIAELHEDDDYVIVPNITAAQIENLPDYVKDNVSAETEHHIYSTFSSMGAAGMGMGAIGSTPTEEFYEHEQFNPNRIYNRRKPVDEPNKLLPEKGADEV